MLTISLLLIVWLIMVMSRIMKDTGHMDRVVESFTHLSKDSRTVGSVMTALIGLLPMPGGALFSAPLVESSLTRYSVSGEQKTLLNYWFRHIWEYWWPLYPGVVLAVAMLNVETWRFMALMAPMSFIRASCVSTKHRSGTTGSGMRRHHGGCAATGSTRAAARSTMSRGAA